MSLFKRSRKHISIALLGLASVMVSGLTTANENTTSVTSISELKTVLSANSIVRGEFTQTRNMEMFAQPLTSQGTFLLDKSSGLLWTQATPFPVSLVLTDNKLSQRFADQPAKIITDKENPMAFYFSHIFLSVFHGDTQKLQEQFSLSFEPANEPSSDESANKSTESASWTLTLIPKSSPMNAVFEAITLQGHNDIERIELKEIRGDSTVIEFSQLSHLPEVLSDAEAQQFQF
ncbi:MULTISPECIES: LolA family protein [Vibrio]|uniref:Outer membrane lipoprotein carrier protein LolA n=3 Tax=Vibrio cyclitrophicus TaxID=47951 RepID=A0A7Z1S1W7_9VIBR|nr:MULTISPECIES: outer membrane lipoprotein carrier protein LolA [Vibrio]KNH11174.1 membrane protein [Vibrio lentus]MBY7661556.1 outer membrane lipoprotein carrier protein LolA [Vibrio atlanticus]ERM61590.1 putative transmembrane protein [Vibrio cyclitrophicus FF75]KAA8596619.1 putative transmembrane protein [Vibrio cyclitrophicus]MBE8554904.1 outer membrane lipoprotein carrier protein LolA [Vibrio sp. OPT24]|tara:strand:- start:1241 stop:1939 length:699 start_codon:yes stop_codon:yes gene_type:complete